ncbi:Peptidoglycan/LPS O-acetylase OafA/YrhL, contains acyltransferase and SGNH-hydrolase domains [Verrucomicrobium sp. GAS474]|uniref:acyltransferase family protein n=1 Tax=Verrucomicrobium sp. GAS474 TaxID=1882831 RepID=UPI000879F943|nr:acyltransferase [Verrucomicrobium sp. GAS474]SDT89410.1 Peptidoglycan/LPS O-acetylase OafA/YrhL, contains acyltransferase and SGNH-hydrolase domains [Verrucomicrobium sp. GAS474]
MTYQPRLDSWRTIAVLAVMGQHWGETIVCGWIGVLLFFVLSGFLITSLLRQRKRKGIDRSMGSFVGGFLGRRVLRLFPPYFLLVAIFAACWLLFRRPPEFRAQWPYLLSFTSNFWHIGLESGSMWFGHLWSLAVEWQIYIAWTALVWWLPEEAFPWIGGLLLLLVPLFRIGAAFLFARQGRDMAFVTLWLYHQPVNYLDAFAMGSLLTWPKVLHFFQRRAVFLALGILAALGGLLVIALNWRDSAGPLHVGALLKASGLGYPVHMGRHGEFLWGYSLLAALGACALAQTMGGAPWTRFTDWRMLQYGGKISYGVYVYHLPLGVLILGALHRLVPLGTPGYALFGLLFLAVDIAVVFTIAAYSYSLYEIRFHKAKSPVSSPVAVSAAG